RTAGAILRTGYNKTHQVDYKGVIDPVTEIDRQSEAFILQAILEKHPDHYILAEESGVVDGKEENAWYIDPVDGTVNYAHGIPIFCVSIAYAHARTMKLAAVYDPMRDEMFTAERGCGAWLNGEPLHVSKVTELKRSLLVTGFPYDMWNTRNDNLADFGHFAKLTQGVRRLGSAALDLCYVGAGRFEGYWERSLKAWDAAAGGLIAEEAGANVTNLDGGEDYISPPQSIIAAPPVIHEQMLSILARTRKDLA
ncbi:MAG: inositol monophosphatase, partial [Anaerolineales bacterium]|nr:inositol monophosphatase [Anaerolineales bacterium]